jgi:ferritin-like metal-binding protein YciE
MMQLVESLRALLIEQLSELYDGEKRVARAIAAWADVCTDSELQAALDTHALETERHVTRIEEMFEVMDTIARGRMCTGIQRLIEESAAHLKGPFETPELRDAAIIAGARRVEHFEIAAYGTAAARARLLELGQVVSLLENTLNEEKAMEHALTVLAGHRLADRAESREKVVCTVN